MKTFEQSPTDFEFVQDPYPFYARARATGDLIWWEDYSCVTAVSHGAVTALLKDRRFGREVPAEFARAIPAGLEDFYHVEAHSMLELEPPVHTRLRGLVLRAFTSRRIKELAPEIEALSHELIDGFPEGDFDLLDRFAQKLPVIIIARLLGVPENLSDQLLAWSNAMVGMYQARRTPEDELAANAAARDFSDFMRGYIAERRSQPADDLITHLIGAEEDGARLSTDELITTCILLLNAGHEATVHTLGNGVKLMLESGARSPAPVEEILRFDPPLHIFSRWAKEDVTLFGHDFKRGDMVNCALASANRDSGVYPQADGFDPSRKIQANTSFGGGIHFCVGAPLARLELQISLDVLFDRCPDLCLAQPAIYADNYHFHGLERLMVRTVG